MGQVLGHGIFGGYSGDALGELWSRGVKTARRFQTARASALHPSVCANYSTVMPSVKDGLEAQSCYKALWVTQNVCIL